MSKSKNWQKMKFRRSEISWEYQPFKFPILNEILQTREHRIANTIDDFSKAVILLSFNIILADGKVLANESNVLRIKLTEHFPNLPKKDLEYLLDNYYWKFTNYETSHIFKYAVDVVPNYINREIKDKTVKNNLCYFLCEIALADNRFSKSEKLMLIKICRALGLTDMDISRLFAFFEGRVTDINFSSKHRWENQAKETKKRPRTKRAQRKPLKQRFNYNLYKYHSALIILGVTKNTSSDQIKRAYKKLVMQYHPDRFINVPDLEKQKSTEMFIKIQDAYELVKKTKRFT